MVGRWGPECCPQTDSVYLYSLPSAHLTHHRTTFAEFTVTRKEKNMLMMPPCPEEKTKTFPIQTFCTEFYHIWACTCSASIWHIQHVSSPQYQSIICYFVPWGIHKLDSIIRGSNDCLSIFGLDFQLCIADIIVWNAVRCGIKFNFSVEIDSVSDWTCKGSTVFREGVIITSLTGYNICVQAATTTSSAFLHRLL